MGRAVWQEAVELTGPARQAFLKDVASPALDEVAEELNKGNAEAQVVREEDGVILMAVPGEAEPFHYAIRLRGYEIPSFAFPEFRPQERTPERRRYYRAEVHLHEGSQGYDVLGYTKAQVIADVLSHFDRHMHILHVAS